MAILASIFAYLGAGAGVVVALLMSFDALLYSPDPSAVPPQTTVTTAKPSGAKPATIATPRIGRSEVFLARAPSHSEAAPQINATWGTPRKPHLATTASREQQVRRFDQQVRAKNWANQQAPDLEPRVEPRIEPRALGYAQEPSIGYDGLW
jgi:hypothetical protein